MRLHLRACATALVAASAFNASGASRDLESWPQVGGNAAEQRFSPLSMLNQTNVAKLGLAWSYEFSSRLGQESTPVVVDGVLYVSTVGGSVRAFNASTGQLQWSYDPDSLGAMVNSCCGPNNRGVAIWKNRVIVGVLDGRLVALDRATGKPVWSVQTTNVDQPYTVSGAPRVVHNTIIIGNGGAELGVRGYVTAYDAATGKQAWRFYTVPGDPKVSDGAASDEVIKRKARGTWSGEFWRRGGGGTVWDAMAYDEQLNLLYIGVGNGSPWNPALRSPGGGDNLFLSSIVALNPDTGKYVWHYQTTPGEAWDFTATQSIILADLNIDGHLRHVLMQAPKNGFFYVLDRQTGELLSAKNYAPVNWASGIDLKSGRPIENPEARYYKTGKPALLLPGSSGAHNWQSMAYSPSTKLAYIPAQNLPMVFVGDVDEPVGAKKTNVSVQFDGSTALTAEQLKQARDVYQGWLAAWDPVEQKEVWRAQLPHFWNGGVLATAGGLVFQGNGGGDFVAYAAHDGTRLWSFDAQTGIIASPVTYRIGSVQYVAVAAGWGGIMPLLGGGVSAVTGKENGPNRLLVFSLNGTQHLPPIPTPIAAAAAKPVTPNAAPAATQRGATLYSRYCFRCHGIGAVGGGVTPDLRFSSVTVDAAAFAQVVSNGALTSRGMSSFGDQIPPVGVEDIRSYLLQRAADSTPAAP